MKFKEIWPIISLVLNVVLVVVLISSGGLVNIAGQAYKEQDNSKEKNDYYKNKIMDIFSKNGVKVDCLNDPNYDPDCLNSIASQLENKELSPEAQIELQSLQKEVGNPSVIAGVSGYGWGLVLLAFIVGGLSF